jgi:hypothetical protein
MREVWFTLAIVFSLSAVVSDAQPIQVIAAMSAVLFWVAFGLSERYGRMNKSKPQSEKDA